MDTNRSVLDDLKGKHTVIILGVLMLLLFIVIVMNHLAWKEIPQNHHKNISDKPNEYINPEDAYLLFEHRYKQNDIQLEQDNFQLIRHHGFLISILCLFLVVSIEKNPNRSKTKKVSLLFVGRYLLISMLLLLLLLMAEILFSWIIGSVLFGFGNFFRPVAVVIHHKVVKLSALEYLLITRALSFVRLLVVCALGVFIRCMFKKRWLALSFTTFMVPGVVKILSNFGVDIILNYRFQDYFFFEFGSMPIKESMFCFLLAHVVCFIILLLGAWLFCTKFRAGEKPQRA